mmetsp:Transcript_89352/g.130720  ORF Transcript_89352/g.130720 Transcript_89352/m.130720 type:complete len:81 (+) Transcript_89352:117-359(+)
MHERACSKNKYICATSSYCVHAPSPPQSLRTQTRVCDMCAHVRAFFLRCIHGHSERYHAENGYPLFTPPSYRFLVPYFPI